MMYTEQTMMFYMDLVINYRF